LEQLHPADSPHWIFGQHAGDQCFHKGGDGAGEVQLFAVEHLYEIGNGVGLEGTHAVYHLEKDYAQRPDICFVGVYFSFEYFRRHVDGRTEHGFGHLVCGVEVFAESEVSKFDDAVMEEDVVGLHIAMHDVVLVEYLEGLE
jgi:hypothetical protein